jgi:transposase
MCAQHQQWLQVSISDRAKQGRFDWVLPQEKDLRAIDRLRGTLPSEQLEFLARVNRMILEAGTDAPAAEELTSTLTQGVWHGMVRNGWVSRSGQINGRAATTRLDWAYKQLALLPEWSVGPATEGACLSRVRKVLADPAQGHPLRALTVLACLFESWGEFLDAVREFSEPVTAGEDAARAGKPEDDTRLELLAAAGGEASVSELAKRFGVAVSTAQAWLASEGWEPPKRPSKLYGPTLSRTVEELTKGCHPSTVSEQLGLSESTVRRVLKTTVGLSTAWRKARHQLDENEARARWSAAISLAAQSGPKTARTFEPGAYAWLYRNDRDWLMRTNALAKQPAIGNKRVVDWDSRDRLLSESCRAAATGLVSEHGGRRITLTDLIRVVPELRTKLHKLSCMPRTALVVKSVLQRHQSSDAQGLLPGLVQD